MNIEMFYYDEHEKMYNEMKMEMEERDKALSSEEREWERQKSSQEARAIMERAERKQKEEYQIVNPLKYQRFVYLSEQAIQFSKISGCNIKVQTFPNMSGLIKMQTACIWLLNDGESALEDAVQVYDQREKLIGYVPRYYAEAFAAFIKEKRVKKGKILCVDKNRNCDECIKIEVSVAGV